MDLFSAQPIKQEDIEKVKLNYFYSEIRKVKPTWTDEECEIFLWEKTPFPFDKKENIVKYINKNLK